MFKYPSLIGENHGREKSYLWSNYSKDDCLVLHYTEKLDGSNFQIRVDHGDVTLFSRNTDVTNDTKSGFYNYYHQHLDYFEGLVTDVKSALSIDTFSIFGELYGEGINRRIDYGKGRFFKVFDVLDFVDDIVSVYTPELYATEFSKHLVPILGSVEVRNLEDLKTLPAPQGSNIEGYVYRYLNDFTSFSYKNSQGLPSVKARVAQFLETSHIKVQKPEDESVKLAKSIISTYITKNRMLNLLSKNSYDLSNKSIRGQILKDFSVDVMDDVNKDGALGEFEHTDIIKASKVIGGEANKIFEVILKEQV